MYTSLLVFMDLYVESIATALAGILQHDATQREQPADDALAFLRAENKNRHEFGMVLLYGLSRDTFAIEVRVAMAVWFKKRVTCEWTLLAVDEQNRVRHSIVSRAIASPPPIRLQLIGALSAIARNASSASWRILLADLVKHLTRADNFVDVCVVLELLNVVLKRLIHVQASEDLVGAFRVVMPSMTSITTELCAALHEPQNLKNSGRALALFACLRFTFRIFFSLHKNPCAAASEFNVHFWVCAFEGFLTDHQTIVQDSPKLYDAAAAVCGAVYENIALLVHGNERAVKPLLPSLVTRACELLVTEDIASDARKPWTVSGLRFLSTVARSSYYALLLSNDTQVLSAPCWRVITSNIAVQETLVDETVDARSSQACDLLEALAATSPVLIISAAREQVDALLLSSSTGAKRAAIKLIICSIPKTEAQFISEFFSLHVLGELLNATDTTLQVAALAFTITFCAEIRRDGLLLAWPGIERLLEEKRNNVHTYAASCVARLISLTEGKGAVTAALLARLFRIFSMPGSEDNEPAIKAVVCAITHIDVQDAHLVVYCTRQLSHVLTRSVQRRYNVTFLTYVYHVITDLVSLARKTTLQATIESIVFSCWIYVLNCGDDACVVCMLHALTRMVNEQSSDEISDAYLEFFRIVLNPVHWQKNSTFKPMANVVCAYVQRSSQQLTHSGYLEGILGVFQKLLASKTHSHDGFTLLCTLGLHVSVDAWGTHLSTIWKLLFHKLFLNPRDKVCAKGLVLFMSLIATLHGVHAVRSTMASIQEGIFEMIINDVFVKQIEAFVNPEERAVVLRAASLFLT